MIKRGVGFINVFLNILYRKTLLAIRSREKIRPLLDFPRKNLLKTHIKNI